MNEIPAFVRGLRVATIVVALPLSVAAQQEPDVGCPGDAASPTLADLREVIDTGLRGPFGRIANAVARRLDLEHDALIASRGCGTFIGSKAGPPPAGIHPRPQVTDCTTWVIDVLRESFVATGRSGDWSRVFSSARASSGSGGFRGTELMKALQSHLGWTGLFWAPDTTTSDSNGEHRYAAHVARTKGTYYGMAVDRSKAIVDYRPEDASRTPNRSGLDRLKRIPFGVLTAKGGMHMAVILNGKVYEVHWADGCESTRLIEDGELETWAWNSGAIVAPREDVEAAWRVQ